MVAHLEKEMFFSVSDWPNISRTRLSTTSCNSEAGGRCAASSKGWQAVGRHPSGQGEGFYGGRREARGERREEEGEK